MRRSLPAPLLAYRIGTTLLSPLAPALLAWRAGKGKEDSDRLGERQGRPGRRRPAGELIWAHGASVGETQSLLPLVEALAARGLRVLVTSGTRTSADLLERRLPAGAKHQFLPLDVPYMAARFVEHWRPQLAIFAESEIWPNLLLELDRRDIPRVLVNARISPRSFRGWCRAQGAAQALFGGFALCLAQSPGDAERLRALGALSAEAVGNLKFDTPPLPADMSAVESFSALVAGRPIWIAASTHPGEEEETIRAHLALRQRWPRLLTLLAPRHPARGDEVFGSVAAAGLACARRSRGALPEGGHDIYLVDTMGELGLFYRTAPLVFMGGSLVPHGGQNPIEPVRLGGAVLHGPHVGNFQEVYDALDAAGGARAVSVETLVGEIGGLLAHPARLRELARRGGEVVSGLAGGLARTMARIEPLLPPRRPASEAFW